MKKYILTKIVAAAILATASPALAPAQTYGPPRATSTVTPVNNLAALFTALDKDHDGTISMEEFRHLSAAMAGIGSGLTARAGEADSSAFRASSPTDEDLMYIYAHLDSNGDNRLTLTEFMNFNQVVADHGGKH
jgi:Ca2+-binding EF-hand superfamily protein